MPFNHIVRCGIQKKMCKNTYSVVQWAPAHTHNMEDVNCEHIVADGEILTSRENIHKNKIEERNNNEKRRKRMCTMCVVVTSNQSAGELTSRLQECDERCRLTIEPQTFVSSSDDRRRLTCVYVELVL